MPPSLEMLGRHSETAYVHLRGPENVISRLQTGDVRVVLDMANAAPADRGTFQLRTDQVVAPAGAEVIWVEPREVTLTIAVVGQATVPVEAMIEGTPAPGFRAAPPPSSPHGRRRRP